MLAAHLEDDQASDLCESLIAAKGHQAFLNAQHNKLANVVRHFEDRAYWGLGYPPGSPPAAVPLSRCTQSLIGDPGGTMRSTGSTPSSSVMFQPDEPNLLCRSASQAPTDNSGEVTDRPSASSALVLQRHLCVSLSGSAEGW